MARLPRVSVQCALKPASGDSQQVEVHLTRRRVGPGRPGSGKGTRAYAPRFPKVKEEGWWLVVGTPDTHELHALKRVTLADRLTTRLTIPRLPAIAHQVRRSRPCSELALFFDLRRRRISKYGGLQTWTSCCSEYCQHQVSRNSKLMRLVAPLARRLLN